MNLFLPFKKSQLKPTWNFSVENILWQIRFGEKIILGEDRNTENREVQFFCINESDGKILWKGNTFGEQWWIGIEAIYNNLIFFHSFKKPDMPEHKKIICADSVTGIELWRNNDVAFYSVSEHFVIAYKDLFERRIYYKLNITDGSVIEELQNEPNEQHIEDISQFLFPLLLSNHSSDYQIVTQTAGKIFSEFTNTTHCEYILYNNYLAMNIYTAEADRQLKNRFFIFNTETKKQIFSEILNRQTPYPTPDSFFIRNSKLYFIVERKTLVAIQL